MIKRPDGDEVAIGDWTVRETYSTVWFRLELRAPTKTMADLRYVYHDICMQAQRLVILIRRSRNRKHRRHRPDEQAARRAMRSLLDELRKQINAIREIAEPGRWREWTEAEKQHYLEHGEHPSAYDPTVMPEREWGDE